MNKGTYKVFFYPDQHPKDTLKASEEFTQVFELRYEAQYPDPPRFHLMLLLGDVNLQIEQIKAVTSCSTHKIDQQQTDG